MPKFVQSTRELSGRPAQRVADVLEQLIDAEGEPIEWEILCAGADIEYPAQMMPAMYALELVGAVVRFDCIDESTLRTTLAFALADEVTIVGDD